MRGLGHMQTVPLCLVHGPKTSTRN
jgi:hypothetical protein